MFICGKYDDRMDVWLCLMYRSVRWADHSSRGVLPCVCVCVCVCVSLSVISATVTLYTDNEHVEYVEEAALREQ
jgi:hypothetical protein